MCKFYKFLYWTIPWSRFRSFLIKKHFSICSQCDRENTVDDRITKILFDPGWVSEEPSMWPKIRSKIDSLESDIRDMPKKPARIVFRDLRWAAGLMILVVGIGIGMILFFGRFFSRDHTVPSHPAQKSRVSIKHAEIKGKKAKAYIYQTPGRSYIMFGSTEKSGG